MGTGWEDGLQLTLSVFYTDKYFNKYVLSALCVYVYINQSISLSAYMYFCLDG